MTLRKNERRPLITSNHSKRGARGALVLALVSFAAGVISAASAAISISPRLFGIPQRVLTSWAFESLPILMISTGPIAVILGVKALKRSRGMVMPRIAASIGIVLGSLGALYLLLMVVFIAGLMISGKKV